jgi:hypothetical protein
MPVYLQILSDHIHLSELQKEFFQGGLYGLTIRMQQMKNAQTVIMVMPTGWSGAEPDGVMPANLGIEDDTSPQAILALLRQLVNEAGVPQENIYIGNPIADIWNTLYDKFYAEFPDIHYVSKRTITGRYKLTPGTKPGIYYSDKGTVMNELSGWLMAASQGIDETRQ